MSALEFQQVSKSYTGLAILTSVSFGIQTGERVVIHGPSGCGKTTILRLLAGFLAPDSGKVLINEQVVAAECEIIIEPERRQLGMVFQDLALWPHLTVAENLEFGLKAQRLAADVRRQRVRDMLARVHLAGSADVYPSKLSGGQQQRVAIARALVTQPRAVLMDEPLSNLDDELRNVLCDQILELHTQLGFTLVYVTHAGDEMRRIGTRAIQMRARQQDLL